MSVSFSYPAYDPLVTIELPSPDKGDARAENSEVFVHTTESGQYKSNKITSCFGEFERNLSFSSLCREEIDNFLNFVTDSFGNYIKYTDYNGVSWVTQITDEVINVSKSPFGYNIDMTLLVWEL